MSETRRDFFRNLGGGVAVALTLEGEAGGQGLPARISAWVHIGADGIVTAYAGKAEMGQNIRTSLAQAVAEELGSPLESVRMVMGDTELTPWDAGTFGSRTTPYLAPQIRKAAAAARGLLIDMAARRWSTPAASLAAADGKVRHDRSGRSASYGELAKGQELLQNIPADTEPTPAKQWNVLGKPVSKRSGREFVTGAHRFVSDMTRPGILHAKVLRPPAWHSTPVSIDLEKAKAIPGVTAVKDGNLVAVAAPALETAEQALEAIYAEWRGDPVPPQSRIYEYLKSHAEPGSSRPGRGSVEAGMAAAEVKLQSTYTVAYIAHAPLEPRAAVAEWTGDKLTVWTGTQRPFGVRAELANALGIPEERIRVIVPDCGGGYGGKHLGDAAVEAARIAKAAGRPVKLVWTREEEFMWAYFRPSGVIEVSSGARKDGRITAWEFHNYNSGAAAIQTPYDIPNQRIEYHPVKSPLRQGSYRALAATANHFARESHMDELAHSMGLDPLDFRLKNATDPRLRAVFEGAADRFGWRRRKKPDSTRGFGIAGGFEKGGYVATCVEVSVARPGGAVRVHRVVEAFECGAVVNPDGLRNQVEGMVMMGLGGALFEEVEFEEGRMQNAGFSRYRVPRFRDLPAIEIVLLDRPDLASAGAGETPICGIAPALANAIFDAAGVRLRALPLAPKGVPL